MAEIISAELLDSQPVSEEEFNRKRELLLPLIYEQCKELREALDAEVTCPCGRKTMPFISGARCFYCGVVFCSKCASRHFGGASESIPGLEGDSLGGAASPEKPAGGQA